MSRLIDADVIYQWYRDSFDFKPNEVKFSMIDIRDNLENIPTADVPNMIGCVEKFSQENGGFSQELVKDLISRQDAIEAVCSAVIGLSDYPPTYAYEIAEEALEKLPPASPDLSTFSDKLWKIAYERGKKEGMQQLHDYQVEWLKSHDDLQLDPQLEKMIIRFLHDTTNCLLMERGDSE